jgi:hypothetical protein
VKPFETEYVPAGREFAVLAFRSKFKLKLKFENWEDGNVRHGLDTFVGPLTTICVPCCAAP